MNQTPVPPPPPRHSALRIHVFAERTTSSQNQSLDTIIVQAISRLESMFTPQVEIIWHEPADHAARRLFEISQLPALGITDIDFSATTGELLERPPNLPAGWKFWRRAERKRALAEGSYTIKLERPLLAHLKDDEQLFFLVRDLIGIYDDRGLQGVAASVDSQIKAAFGAKAMKTIAAARKVFPF